MKFPKIVALTMVFFGVFPLMVKADELSEALEQKEYYDSQLNIINQQIQNEQNKIYNASNNINAYRKQENAIKQELNQTQSEIQRLEQEISGLEEEIKASEDNYNKKLEQFKKRLNVMYKQSNSSYLKILLESKNLGDFFQKIQYLIQLSKQDKATMEELAVAKADLQSKIQLKQNEKLQNQKIADDKMRDIEQLAASRAAEEEIIRKSQIDLSRLSKQEDEIAEQSRAWTNYILRLQNANSSYAGGEMVWPVPSSGYISSLYGYRIHPILGTYRFHTGIDISASSGSPIIAANKGVVIFSGYQSGYGNTIIIDHGGGMSTLYAHCSRLWVGIGASVEKGEQIANVGSTGLATGPHLHFEVRENGQTTDPLGYVSY